MVDLQKPIMEGKEAPAIVQAVAGEEQEPLVPADVHVDPIEGGSGLIKYWLLLVASVMVLTDHVVPDGGGDDDHGAAPKDHLITLLLVVAKFALLLWATCLVSRAMKRME